MEYGHNPHLEARALCVCASLRSGKSRLRSACVPAPSLATGCTQEELSARLAASEAVENEEGVGLGEQGLAMDMLRAPSLAIVT